MDTHRRNHAEGRRASRLLAAARRLAPAVLALGAGWGHAQGSLPYPVKPVSLYVGISPGSTTDSTARAMALRLTEQMGQQFVVINRDGMAGVIAATQVAKAKPDGYTLMWVGISVMASGPALSPKTTPYNAEKDFAPVSVYMYAPYIIVAHPSLPVKDLKGLLAIAKAQPDKLTYGSSGVGGALHLAVELMLNMSGTKMVHVPYRGSPAMMLDVLSGRLDLVATSTSLGVPHIQSGRLRPIAVTSSQRSPRLPNVPTMSEAGLRGYDVTAWYSLVAPAGTPRDIINSLHKNFVTGLEHPAVKANIAEEGAIAGGNTPEQFATFIHSEIEKYSRLVKSAGLQASEP